MGTVSFANNESITITFSGRLYSPIIGLITNVDENGIIVQKIPASMGIYSGKTPNPLWEETTANIKFTRGHFNITLGKKDTLQTSKMLVSQLQDSKSANKVKKTLSKRYEKRNGGYTRIIKAGFRYGDNAPMAIIEFVDRDVEAKRVDKKKKDTKKETPKAEEKKIKTA